MSEENKDKDKKDIVTGTPTIVRSDKYVNLYSNQVEVGFSAWDIQLSFLQIHGRVSDVKGEEIASITMSPQHAKAMVLPLIRSVMQYETQHGVVRIPGQTEHTSLWDMLVAAVQKSIKESEESAASALTAKQVGAGKTKKKAR